jgi:Cd2+-exporting ATPase
MSQLYLGPLDSSMDMGIGGPVSTLTFNVEGMTCSSCESSLKRALLSINGVDLVSVNVVLGQAVVEGMAASREIIQIASQRTGFKLTLIESQPNLFLRFSTVPKEFPPDVVSLLMGNIVKFTYDPKNTNARDIFDFYGQRGNTPEVVDDFDVTYSIWRSLGCRVIISVLLAIPVLVLAYIPPRPILYGAIQMVLVTGIMLYVISPLYRQALVTLVRQRQIEMDLLVVMSTSVAYIFSIISYAFACVDKPISEPFWETPALLVTLIVFGRWITSRARERAVKQVKSLSNTNVKTATLKAGRVIDVALLGYGDIVVVQPGETIPADGLIVKGETEVSEAMFTGESTPKAKRCGSNVFAGSVNLTSPIDIRVTKIASENALSGIRQLINFSQVNKPRIQEYTDRIAGYLGPVAFAAAIVALIVWFFVNWRLRGQTPSQAAIQGITYAITVLAISCPCTIGLAVPMNVVIASGIAAAQGVLIKDTQALEVMHRAKTVVFDKTGTVTKGELEVEKEISYAEGAGDYVRRLVATARHPVAIAVSKYLGDAEPFDCVQTVVGKGLEVTVDEHVLRGGSASWLEIDKPLTDRNLSVFCATLDGRLIAVYGLSDELRAESRNVVEMIHSKNIEVYLVSGDTEASALETARKLGIPESHVKSCALPADKAQIIQSLQHQSRAPVVFCGDGINDAPALSQADIGISFVSASEITSSAAAVLFLSNDLSSLLTLFRLSRRVYRRIIVNFAWAGIYNLVAICLSAGVFVVWRIEPQWAGIGEIVSIMPVIVVGWSLKWDALNN